MQALTTSVAFWYGIETFRLRSQAEQLDEVGPHVRATHGWAPGGVGEWGAGWGLNTLS
jgi:hypothetical protein